MARRPMEGVRIVEVAQFTYTPASGAVLADWGADVIKVEHAFMGDAQRGLKVGPASYSEGSFAPIMEHQNRGKRSIGLALDTPGGLDVLYEIVRGCDVFVTNFLPDARERLRIDVEHIREVNPQIIYVRGSAFGSRGPEALKGGFDSSAFWSRGGGAVGVTPTDGNVVLGMPAPAFGDSIGGMTIAGGIAGALFARERTGETSIIDVSLLSTAAWASGLAVDVSLLSGVPHAGPTLAAGSFAMFNPIVSNMRTSDGRWINLAMLQPGRYWADFCRHIDREDLIDDPRFATAELIMANAEAGAAIVQEEIAKRPYAEWVERFRTLDGQWAPVQNSLEIGNDPQLRANGYIATVVDADGVERELVANPVQFDETPAVLTRAPQFAEHTDDILRELGRSEDDIIQLKIDGAVT